MTFDELLTKYDVQAEWSDCPPGWIASLEAAFIAMKKLGWCGAAAQIKEKYGTGRFYMQHIRYEQKPATNERGWNYEEVSRTPRRNQKKVDALATEWERGTAKLCQTCGAEGWMRDDGWYFTACDEHAYSRHDEKKEHYHPRLVQVTVNTPSGIGIVDWVAGLWEAWDTLSGNMVGEFTTEEAAKEEYGETPGVVILYVPVEDDRNEDAIPGPGHHITTRTQGEGA